ncbi:MAG: MFS transporter, partial [Spirochaetales bacterium]|nr:MFS transporter [Candidatus Physcosoma equi]
FLLLSRFHFWEKRNSLILVSQGAFAFLTVLMVFFQSASSFALLYIAYGVFFALSYQLSIYHSAQGEEGRHMRMTIHEALLTAGTMGGSLAGGIIYQNFSFRTLVYAIATVCVVFILLEALVLAKKRKKRLHRQVNYW